MTAKSLIELIQSQSFEVQAKGLASWMHAATIDARGTYIPGTEAIADPVRLRRFNELQHRLSGHLRGTLDGVKLSGEFLSELLETARDLQAVALRDAIDKSVTQAEPRKHRRAG